MNIDLDLKKAAILGAGIIAVVILAVVNPLAVGCLLVGIAAGYAVRPKIEPKLSGLLKSKKDKRIEELENQIKKLKEGAKNNE